VRGLIEAGKISACHDLSDGGLAVAAAEMALAGQIGLALEAPATLPCPAHAWLFGEDQGRYLVTTAQPAALLAAAQAAGVPAARVGRTGGAALTLPGGGAISLTELRQVHEGWLPRYMNGHT
jgi:phosphoribosylformylglycinamidine (FGAM) synthase-like enzyme